jgi:hypothetical protein
VITRVDGETTTTDNGKGGSAHVFVCECFFEFIVGHESHARLDRISDDKSGTASVHPAYAVRAQRLADYLEWRLALGVIMVALDCPYILVALAKREGKKRETHFSAEL